MENNKTKKYYLSYVIDDEYGDETIKKEVDFVSDNLYDYPELEVGWPVDLIEVDTATGEEKILHTYAFVNVEKSVEEFGSEPDADGFRTFFVNASIDTLSIHPCKIRTDKIQVIDAMYYLLNYDQEHAKRVAEKKAQEEKGAGQPGDDNN